MNDKTPRLKVGPPFRALLPWQGRMEEWLSPYEILAAIGASPATQHGDFYTVLSRMHRAGLLERRDTTYVEANSSRWRRVALLYRPAQ